MDFGKRHGEDPRRLLVRPGRWSAEDEGDRVLMPGVVLGGFPAGGAVTFQDMDDPVPPAGQDIAVVLGRSHHVEGDGQEVVLDNPSNLSRAV